MARVRREQPVKSDEVTSRARHQRRQAGDEVGGKTNRKGTPQGGVISPLLANLYLHLLDRIWERHNLELRHGARLVRYADDLVILCRVNVSEPMEVLQTVLERLDSQLNEAKTRVVDSRWESFDFLGYSCRMRRSRKSGKFYPHVEPSKRAIRRLKDRVKQLTDRRRCPVPLGDVVNVFRHVKMQVEERLRTHLRRRHKLRSRGMAYIRFPNHRLYERYGLLKLPTTAGWTTAHALR